MKKKLTFLLALYLGISHFSTIHAQNFAIFWDSNFIENFASCNSEGYSVEQTVIDLGYTISQYITDIDNFTTDLAGIDILLIPETEIGEFDNDITPANATAIRDFVNNGGVLIHFGGSAFSNSGGSNSSDNLNTIFGFSLSESGFMSVGSTSILPAETAGTCFESGASTLDNQSGTHLLINTLPEGSKCFYKDANDETSVVTIPFGAGSIFYLGWDWYRGGPGCTLEDSGWSNVLDCAIKSGPITGSLVELPVMNNLLMLVFFLGLLLLGWNRFDSLVKLK